MDQSGTDSYKNIIVIGITGVGKSFLLNLLLGAQRGDTDEFFTTSQSNRSCTRDFNSKRGKLWGYGVPIHVIDTPGLYDSEDVKDLDNPLSLQHIKTLHQIVENEFKFKINRLLLCIDSTAKMDDRHKYIHKICNILMPSKQNVCVILTKFNNIPTKAKKGYKDSWSKDLQEMGIEDFYFFEDTLKTVDKNFQRDLEKSLRENIKTWGYLNSEERQVIAKAFKYNTGACFSFDMLISLQDNTLMSINEFITTDLFSPHGHSTLLGFIHYDRSTPTLFKCFALSNNMTLECTDNHLVFCVQKRNGMRINTYLIAQEIEEGDFLLECQEGKTQEVMVHSTSYKTKIGFWCPLTSTGDLVVNSVLVSSYVSPAKFITQSVAHNAMRPLIAYRQFFGAQLQLRDQFNPYAQILKRLIGK